MPGSSTISASRSRFMGAAASVDPRGALAPSRSTLEDERQDAGDLAQPMVELERQLPRLGAQAGKVDEPFEPRLRLEPAHRQRAEVDVAGRRERRVVPGPAVPPVPVPPPVRGLRHDPPTDDRRRRAGRGQPDVVIPRAPAEDALDLHRRERRVLEAGVVEQPEAGIVVLHRRGGAVRQADEERSDVVAEIPGGPRARPTAEPSARPHPRRRWRRREPGRSGRPPPGPARSAGPRTRRGAPARAPGRARRRGAKAPRRRVTTRQPPAARATRS